MDSRLRPARHARLLSLTLALALVVVGCGRLIAPTPGAGAAASAGAPTTPAPAASNPTSAPAATGSAGVAAPATAAPTAPPPPPRTATPVLVATPRLGTAPPQTIVFCIDNTESYPRDLFAKSLTLAADTAEGLVRVGQPETTIFIQLITQNSYQPTNTVAVLAIPALPLEPFPPTLRATPTDVPARPARATPTPFPFPTSATTALATVVDGTRVPTPTSCPEGFGLCGQQRLREATAAVVTATAVAARRAATALVELTATSVVQLTARADVVSANATAESAFAATEVAARTAVASDNARARAEAAAANAALEAGHQQAVVTQQTTLASARSAIKARPDELRKLQPTPDRVSSDVWGCLHRAAERLGPSRGEKMLVLASDMDETADNPRPDEIALKGVKVRIVNFHCTQARDCEQRRASWTRGLEASGATAVRFYDPAETQVLRDLLG